MLFDRQGDLWLGTAGRGLVQWRGYSRWSNWSAAPGQAAEEVWSFLDGDDGPDLWLGMVQLGPWQFHPLVLMFALSGSLMISKTLRIPKP